MEEIKPRKFYISDLHFGHANCLAFDNRPFKSIEHHDAELVRRWNSVVRPGDTVYILGDMFWCKATEAVEILKQLNGQKILIKGNHDRCHDINFKKCFVKICEYEEVEDGEDKIVIRSILPICIAFDHRALDFDDIIPMIKAFDEIFADFSSVFSE